MRMKMKVKILQHDTLDANSFVTEKNKKSELMLMRRATASV